jgi:hypothetical protein
MPVLPVLELPKVGKTCENRLLALSNRINDKMALITKQRKGKANNYLG